MRLILALALLIGLRAEAAPFDYLLISPADQTSATLLLDVNFAALATDGHGNIRADICIQGVQRWSTLQDVAGTDSQGNPTVTHTYMPGFGVVCEFQTRQPALEADAITYLVTDYGAAALGKPFVVLTPYFAIAQLQTMVLQPVFAGAAYQFQNAAMVQLEQ